MTEIRDQLFVSGQKVEVDGVSFVNCGFEEGVELRYAGGEHPRFEECTIGNAYWFFTDAALRTIQFLQAQNLKGQGQAMLDDMFRAGNYIGE